MKAERGNRQQPRSSFGNIAPFPNRSTWIPKWLGFSLGGLEWLALMLVAIVLRLSIAYTDPLWLDELHTGWVVGEGVNELWSRAAAGNQTPLYFWLTWLVPRSLNYGELGLRLVSVVSGLGLLVTLSLIVRRMTCSWLATLLTGMIVTFSDWFLVYATEARPYALLQWLSVIQVLCFYQWVRSICPSDNSKPARWLDQRLDRFEQPGAWVVAGWSLGLFLTSLAMAYTHYTSVLIAIPEIAFGIGWYLRFRWVPRLDRTSMENSSTPESTSGPASPKRQDRYLIVAVGVILVGMVLACLPLIPNVLLVAGRRANWSSVAFLGRFWNSMGSILAVWLLAPLIVIGFYRWRHNLSPSGSDHKSPFPGPRPVEVDKPAETIESAEATASSFFDASPGAYASGLVELLAIWGIAGPVLLSVLHGLNWAPLAMPRYLSFAIASGPLLSGLAVGVWSSRKARIIAFSILLAGNALLNWQAGGWVSSSISQRRPLPLRSESWFQTIEKINGDSKRQAYPVFLFAGVIEDELALEDRTPAFQNYLQFPVRSLYPLRPAERYVFAGPTMSRPHFLEQELARARNAGGAWLLIRHTEPIIREIEQEFYDRIGVPIEATQRHRTYRGLVDLIHIDLLQQ